MYSILKSQKRCLIHQKKVSVTSSIFLTNSYIFLSFSDCSCAIYFLNLSSQSNSKTEQKQKIWKGFTSSPVLQAKRLMEGTCVLICKNYTNIYVIEMWEVLQQHRMEVEMKSIEKSQFVDVMASQADHGLLNTLGCQTRLHAYTSGCFTIQHYVYEDRKLILDCYKYKKGKTPHNGQWELFLIQIDVEINGHFVIQSINWHTGQIAIYKQSELNDAIWSLRVFSPFCQPQPQYQVQNPHGPPIFDRQVKITLPQNKFDEDTNIIQICQYNDGAYLIIVNSKSTGKMRGIALNGLTQNITGNVPQTMFNFIQIPESKLQFLGENFTKIVYGNPKDDLYITQTHQHQTIDGQLYFNGLMISNMRTGNPIQKGYCTLRNIDFSPNYRYILDVPYEYDKICGKQTLFHVRLLLSKASLYMFLMEGWKGVENIGPSFKNLIIQLL